MGSVAEYSRGLGGAWKHKMESARAGQAGLEIIGRSLCPAVDIKQAVADGDDYEGNGSL